MILAGLVTVIEWDGLFLDRRDYQILTPWPIQARTIFKAKAAALFQFLLLFTLAVNAVPAVLFPLGVLAKRTTLFECGRYLLSHALSILAGNTFVFLFAIALQGMLLSLFPSRIASAITRTARFLLLLVLLCALLSFIGVPPADVLLKNRDIFVYCYPPMWFLGVYEFLLGKADPVLLWDGRMVLLHLSFGVIMSLGLMDILLTDLRMIPFTCAYPPGKANFKMRWPVYLFGFTTYAFTTTILESWMLRVPVRFVVFYGLAIALLGALALRRLQSFKLGFKFMFEEEPQDAPQLLKLIE
jgi:hypothetical protein